MLKTVLELKGEKRFRRQPRNSSVDPRSTIESGTDNINQAKETMRMMSLKSSYNRQFGDRPKEAEAYHIVKKKKFSELDFASILKPEPCAMIERWIIGDSDEEFVSRVFFTLREMYTIIRARANYATTNRDLYIDAPKFQGAQPFRFDRFEKDRNATKR